MCFCHLCVVLALINLLIFFLSKEKIKIVYILTSHFFFDNFVLIEFFFFFLFIFINILYRRNA